MVNAETEEKRIARAIALFDINAMLQRFALNLYFVLCKGNVREEGKLQLQQNFYETFSFFLWISVAIADVEVSHFLHCVIHTTYLIWFSNDVLIRVDTRTFLEKAPRKFRSFSSFGNT